MIRKDGRCECDYCHGVEGSFFSDTGNHVSCQQIGEQTTVASLVDAELTALRERVAELGLQNTYLEFYKANADAWKEYAKHQEYCAVCAGDVDDCETGTALRSVADVSFEDVISL